MASSRRTAGVAVVCACLASAVLLYARVFADLVRTWVTDENYSHGLVVLPVVAYLVWKRRDRLAATERRPSAIGFWIVVASLLVLLVGTAGVEFFLVRISAIGVLVGTILFLAGWSWVRVLLFPLALTLLMIPLPPVVFYQIAFPLQLLATRFGVAILQAVRIPVLREGNVIALAHTTLEVTEACSGIRSLLSLLTLAVLYGYFALPGTLPRVVVVLSSVPVAIVANGLRIAGTGMAAQYIGPAAAGGFFHSFSGWVVFMTSTVMLLGLGGLRQRLTPAIAFPPPVSTEP
jgi:exosortase